MALLFRARPTVARALLNCTGRVVSECRDQISWSSLGPLRVRDLFYEGQIGAIVRHYCSTAGRPELSLSPGTHLVATSDKLTCGDSRCHHARRLSASSGGDADSSPVQAASEDAEDEDVDVDRRRWHLKPRAEVMTTSPSCNRTSWQHVLRRVRLSVSNSTERRRTFLVRTARTRRRRGAPIWCMYERTLSRWWSLGWWTSTAVPRSSPGTISTPSRSRCH